MSRGDELDGLLTCEAMDEEAWDFVCHALGKRAARKIVRPKRVASTNRHVRHACYGHSVVNLFRDRYQPDYGTIVQAVAKRMKIKVYPHQSVYNLEDRILQEALEAMKAKYIKEHGEEAWAKIEAEAEEQLRKMAAERKLPNNVAMQIKGIGGGAMGAAIGAGRLSGIGVYLWANKLFFMVSRNLGLHIGVATAGPFIGKSLAVLLGPAGWLMTALWLVYDFGNTNWKQTTNAVIAIALLRRHLEWRSDTGDVTGEPDAE